MRLRSLLDQAPLSEYWQWVASALFLLLPVDLVTTVYAADVVGIEREANPWMALLLQQSTPVIIIIHLAVLVVTVAGFALYERTAQRSEKHGAMLMRAGIVYLILLVGAGFVVFVSNLLVIFSAAA